MDERFDPGVRTVLDAMGSMSGPATPAQLLELLAEGEGSEAGALARDPDRLMTILDQLVENGLAQRSPSGYRLTHLGRLRVERGDERDDERA
jgi:hypothetical protein